jgi:hypothetical protein
MEHVRVGGWAEVCVGEWAGDKERVVFGYIVRIPGRRTTLRVADEVFSPAKTGFTNGQLIEVDLEDIFGSEFSPFQVELEARRIQNEIESQLIAQHQAEFDAFCPPEYALTRMPLSASATPEEWDAHAKGYCRARREFVEQLIRKELYGQR